MHVAAVQLDVQWEDRAASHARVRKLLGVAALPAGTLVVLPEMFDVGFSMNTAVTDPGAESASERLLRELAREKSIATLAGVVARTAEGKLANEAVAFAPDGQQLVRYRKMQPFTPPGEDVHYPAGDRQASFAWQGVRIAPFVCYDLRFPELFRPAARDGGADRGRGQLADHAQRALGAAAPGAGDRKPVLRPGRQPLRKGPVISV